MAASIRSLAEIAVLAAYLLFVPQAVEFALNRFGLTATGYTQVFVTSVLYVVFFLLAAAMTWLSEQRLADLGLRPPKGVAKAFLFGLLVAAAGCAIVEILERTGILTRDLSDVASLKGNFPLLLCWVAMVVVLTGIIEEFIYRGFLMDRLSRIFGSSRSAVIVVLCAQAVIFGLAHAYGDWQLVIFATAAGLIYGVMFLASGRNLWSPIIAHSAYDVSRVAIAYYLLTFRH